MVSFPVYLAWYAFTLTFLECGYIILRRILGSATNDR